MHKVLAGATHKRGKISIKCAQHLRCWSELAAMINLLPITQIARRIFTCNSHFSSISASHCSETGFATQNL